MLTVSVTTLRKETTSISVLEDLKCNKSFPKSQNPGNVKPDSLWYDSYVASMEEAWLELEQKKREIENLKREKEEYAMKSEENCRKAEQSLRDREDDITRM